MKRIWFKSTGFRELQTGFIVVLLASMGVKVIVSCFLKSSLIKILLILLTNLETLDSDTAHIFFIKFKGTVKEKWKGV